MISRKKEPNICTLYFSISLFSIITDAFKYNFQISFCSVQIINNQVNDLYNYVLWNLDYKKLCNKASTKSLLFLQVTEVFN